MTTKVPITARGAEKLREELVQEKLRSDSLTGELDALRRQLKRLGIDQNILDGEEEMVSNE